MSGPSAGQCRAGIRRVAVAAPAGLYACLPQGNVRGAFMAQAVLRPHAEQSYVDELAALSTQDDRPRPPSWNVSPWAVVLYLMGGTLPDGTVISPKYVGSRRLIEVAVATLAT